MRPNALCIVATLTIAGCDVSVITPGAPAIVSVADTLTVKRAFLDEFGEFNASFTIQTDIPEMTNQQDSEALLHGTLWEHGSDRYVGMVVREPDDFQLLVRLCERVQLIGLNSRGTLVIYTTDEYAQNIARLLEDCGIPSDVRVHPK